MIVSFFVVYTCGIKVVQYLKAKLFNLNDGQGLAGDTITPEAEPFLEFPIAIDGTSYVDSEGDIKFAPPVYSQRYMAVTEELEVLGPFKKVVELGCNSLALFPFIKHQNGIEDAVFVDIDHQLLTDRRLAVAPLTADHLRRRSAPLRVRILSGNAAVPDINLASADAVIAIELIEHMYPPDLNSLPYCIFGVVQPRLVVITTPNADFNVLFTRDTPGQFRDPDHKFEWTRRQFHDWARNIIVQYPEYSVTLKGIGPGPEGTSQYGTCSQMAVFVRNCPSNLDLSLFKDEYEVVEDLKYPFVPYVEPTPEEKIAETLRKYFAYQETVDDHYSYDNGQVEVPIPVIHRLLSNVSKDTDFLRRVILENGYMIEETDAGQEVVIPPPEEVSTSAGGDSYDGQGSEEVLFSESYNQSDSDVEVWGTDTPPLSPFQSEFVASTPLAQPAAGDVLPLKDVCALAPAREFVIDVQALSAGDKTSETFNEPTFLGSSLRERRDLAREFGEGPSSMNTDQGKAVPNFPSAISIPERMETIISGGSARLLDISQTASENVSKEFSRGSFKKEDTNNSLGVTLKENLSGGGSIKDKHKGRHNMEKNGMRFSNCSTSSEEYPASHSASMQNDTFSAGSVSLSSEKKDSVAISSSTECLDGSSSSSEEEFPLDLILSKSGEWVSPASGSGAKENFPGIKISPLQRRKSLPEQFCSDDSSDHESVVLDDHVLASSSPKPCSSATEEMKLAVRDGTTFEPIGVSREKCNLSGSKDEPQLTSVSQASGSEVVKTIVAGTEENTSKVPVGCDDTIREKALECSLSNNSSHSPSVSVSRISCPEPECTEKDATLHRGNIQPVEFNSQDLNSVTLFPSNTRSDPPTTSVDNYRNMNEPTAHSNCDTISNFILSETGCYSTTVKNCNDETTSSDVAKDMNNFNNEFSHDSSKENLAQERRELNLRPTESSNSGLNSLLKNENSCDEALTEGVSDDGVTKERYPVVLSSQIILQADTREIIGYLQTVSSSNNTPTEEKCSDVTGASATPQEISESLKVINQGTEEPSSGSFNSTYDEGKCSDIPSNNITGSPQSVCTPSNIDEKDVATEQHPDILSEIKVNKGPEESQPVSTSLNFDLVVPEAKSSNIQFSQIKADSHEPQVSKDCSLTIGSSSCISEGPGISKENNSDTNKICTEPVYQSSLKDSERGKDTVDKFLQFPYNLSQSCDSSVMCEQLFHSIEASQSEDNIVYKNVDLNSPGEMNGENLPLKSCLRLSINGNYEVAPALCEKENGVAAVVSTEQTPNNLNIIDFSVGKQEKGEDHATMINRCKSLQLIRESVEKKANRFSLCCEKDERGENRLYGMGWSLEEVGGCWREETEVTAVDDSRSQSRAADSGYPNTADRDPDMDTDLTPEQVDELLSENESSFDEREDEEEEPQVDRPLPGGAAPVQFAEHVENGDVANNNQDGEGNNLDGEEILAFDLVELQGNEQREEAPERHHDSDSEDENKYVSASESLMSETIVADEEIKDMDEALDVDIWTSTPARDWSRTSTSTAWASPISLSECTDIQAGPSWQNSSWDQQGSTTITLESVSSGITFQDSQKDVPAESWKTGQPQPSAESNPSKAEGSLQIASCESRPLPILPNLDQSEISTWQVDPRLGSSSSSFECYAPCSGSIESAQITASLEWQANGWERLASSSSLIAHASSSSLSPPSVVFQSQQGMDFPSWLRNMFADDMEAMGDTQSVPSPNEGSSDFLLLPEEIPPDENVPGDIMGGGEPHFHS